MNLQTIKSLNGQIEYVLLPIATYTALQDEITKKLGNTQDSGEYDLFDPADYVDNPVALARIIAGISQKELARCMKVTQAYISKLENQDKVSAKVMKKIVDALNAENDTN